MAFKLDPSVSVVRDEHGSVVAIEHIQQPYSSGSMSGLRSSNPRTLGAEYLRNVSHVFGIPNSFLGNLSAPVATKPTEDGISLRFVEEKSTHIVTTVSYVQTVLGLPIWESGFSVSVLPSPLRATSSVSSVKFDVKVHAPRRPSAELDKITPEKLLGLSHGGDDVKPPIKTTSTRFLVYRYDPAARQEGGEAEGTPRNGPSLVPGSAITLPLPPVSKEIRPGLYYVVREILFTYPLHGVGDIHWRLFSEVETDSVLYLRAFASGAKGYVYLHDPITTINGPLPTASNADLDPLRTLVLLPGITPRNPQSLAGDHVNISELDPPVIPGPTDAAGHFLYSVDTDGFAATNAYYHIESLFHKMTQLGFDLSSLFSHTAQNPGFPVPVDQSAESGAINAHSWGNSMGNGSGGFIFGRAASPGTVSIAADFRVVCHEFCHAIMWDNISSPNFGFAHSAGDAIGVILSDPASEAPDRGLTFPWITAIPRRHDRDVTQGWAWGGTMHDGGYQSEQILSTTLFRAYLAIGGGATPSTLSTWFETQTWAANYIVYLIVGGIASLATAPITPSPNAEVFATAMMGADAGVLGFDRQPGGAIRKVLRWAFEQQGAYQPAGAPTPVASPGAPPDVDVYIDDGRNGEYTYVHVFWETLDIWNRTSADGGLAHQTPIVNVPNYGYVRVKNRGTQTATNVVVSGYHVRPSAGLVWPDTYQPMTTASINVPGGIPSGGSVVVGPFEWTPAQIGHECMLMSVSCPDDRSNIDAASGLPCAVGPVPDYRFVPFDNNIAQRNVAPVPGGGGATALHAGLHGKQFWVHNPYDRVARVHIEAQLPVFLRRRGWAVAVRADGAGAGTVSLGPRAALRFIIDVREGQDFPPPPVGEGAHDNNIRLLALIDGIVVGGMSYAVDPTLKKPAPEHKSPDSPCHREPDGDGKDDVAAAGALLKCLGLCLPADCITDVEVSRITVEIGLKKQRKDC